MFARLTLKYSRMRRDRPAGIVSHKVIFFFYIYYIVSDMHYLIPGKDIITSFLRDILKDTVFKKPKNSCIRSPIR